MTRPAAIVSVDIVRSGRALRVGFADGATRLVRRVDLAPALGEPTAGSRPFAAVRVVDDHVEVDYERGPSDRIAAARFAVPDAADVAPDLVVTGIGALITADGDADGDDPLGHVRDAAVVCGGGRVVWVGPAAELDAAGLDTGGADRIDAEGAMVTPGLIDCHAHPVFAGNRADELRRRAAGESYLDIGRAGGGIAATVRATREASFDELVALTWHRARRALAAGTTTLEAKSGYDLTVDGELRLLEAALAVDALSPVDLVPTLLGAHTLPPERKDDRDGFVADVCERMIPAAAERRLARAVDVYCDEGAFTLDETRRILEAGRAAGLMLRAHAGQFADLGCPELLASLGGRSADHLEVVSDDGIRAMAAHGVAAVMLPAACVQLRMEPPPVAALRAGGVALAVATDMNPGTTAGETLPIAMWLACTHYGMTVEEAWLGVTRHAAAVLGRHDIGVVCPGATADLVVWDAEVPAEVPYRFDRRLVRGVVKAGRPVV